MVTPVMCRCAGVVIVVTRDFKHIDKGKQFTTAVKINVFIGQQTDGSMN